MKPYITHVARYRRGRLYRAVDYAACARVARALTADMVQHGYVFTATDIQEHRDGKPKRWG